jgi:hypothetical protein
MLLDAVNTLLSKFGSSLTLTRVTGATYSASTGQVGTGTTTNFTIRGAFINYSDELMDGTIIRVGDRRLLVSPAGSTTTPQIGDIVGGLKLIDVRVYAPAGVPVAWACQARK